MGTIFKVFIEFVTILFLCYVFWLFGHLAGGILALIAGVEPAPTSIGGVSLNHLTPGKSLS